MAEIAPFRGLRYDPLRVGSLAEVVTPPYDVIGPTQRDDLYLRHEQNIIRLILGKERPGDNGHESSATRAGRLFRRWWAQGVLVRDERPAVYLYEIDYPGSQGQGRITRKGFISLVRLSRYGQGPVRPHERTFSATKEKRLKLIQEAKANFSQIFTLYDDPAGEVASALEEAPQTGEAFKFTTDDGVGHCLRAVTDPKALARVAKLMAPKNLYIADGHHRYETCLAYQDLMRRTFPQAPDQAAFNYTTIYASALQDKGVRILPAHRLVKNPPDLEGSGFMDRLGGLFDIQEFPLSDGPRAARQAFKTALAGDGKGESRIGLVRAGEEKLRVLSLKNGAMAETGLAPCLQDLDVMVLNNLIYGRCLGLSMEELDDERRFLYDPKLDSALDRTLEGEVELAFVLNPTRLDQLRAVCEAGLIMPSKSTYFHPKVHTGLVINPLVPSETVYRPEIP
jgi:uncharacterized protein (DUF1015 family)